MRSNSHLALTQCWKTLTLIKDRFLPWFPRSSNTTELKLRHIITPLWRVLWWLPISVHYIIYWLMLSYFAWTFNHSFIMCLHPFNDVLGPHELFVHCRQSVPHAPFDRAILNALFNWMPHCEGHSSCLWSPIFNVSLVCVIPLHTAVDGIVICVICVHHLVIHHNRSCALTFMWSILYFLVVLVHKCHL